MNTILEELSNRQLVWRGTSAGPAATASPSGFALLDEKLGGGFPHPSVVELHSPLGIGELRLLLPFLAQQQNRLVVFIVPPASVHAELLASAGLDLARVLVVTPSDAQQALWAAEQCLKSGCCHAVLLWQNKVQTHQAKRLQLAAQEGRATQFIFRTDATVRSLLPVSLSLQLAPHAQGIGIQVLRRKGGWPVPRFVMPMNQQWPELILPTLPHNVTRLPEVKVG